MQLNQLNAARHEEDVMQSPHDIDSDMCGEADEEDPGATVAESEPEFSDGSKEWTVNWDMDTLVFLSKKKPPLSSLANQPIIQPSTDPNSNTLALLGEKPDTVDTEPIDDDVLATDENSQCDYSDASVVMNLDDGSFHIHVAMGELPPFPEREPEPVKLERPMLQRWVDTSIRHENWWL